MVIHEQSLVDFATLELSGDSARSARSGIVVLSSDDPPSGLSLSEINISVGLVFRETLTNACGSSGVHLIQ